MFESNKKDYTSQPTTKKTTIFCSIFLVWIDPKTRKRREKFRYIQWKKQWEKNDCCSWKSKYVMSFYLYFYDFFSRLLFFHRIENILGNFFFFFLVLVLLSMFHREFFPIVILFGSDFFSFISKSDTKHNGKKKWIERIHQTQSSHFNVK